jgi:hypothetical protein
VQPERPGIALDELFRSLAPLKLDETARSFRACRAFARACGPIIRARARAERLQGAILYVRCVSSVWSQQLSVERHQIVAKLNRTPGGEGVMDLRFRVGLLDELPDWEEPALAAALDTGAAPPALPLEIESAVADVGDAELRALLAAAARPRR